jgi:hypothetical protein
MRTSATVCVTSGGEGRGRRGETLLERLIVAVSKIKDN